LSAVFDWRYLVPMPWRKKEHVAATTYNQMPFSVCFFFLRRANKLLLLLAVGYNTCTRSSREYYDVFILSLIRRDTKLEPTRDSTGRWSCVHTKKYIEARLAQLGTLTREIIAHLLFIYFTKEIIRGRLMHIYDAFFDTHHTTPHCREYNQQVM
jgi:hypothetical protein